jgi:predicted O-methyltransferase YrrM
MSNFHHSDFVQLLAYIQQPKLYLELGLYEGETWNKVTPFCQRKIGVDIVDRGISGEVHIETTDSFFSHFNEKIDMAFIDADHKFESSKQDFLNCYERLNEGGIIIMHDTDPMSNDLFSFDRCGDSYKIVDFLEKEFKDINIVTLPVTEAGLSIITKKQTTRTHLRNEKNLS